MDDLNPQREPPALRPEQRETARVRMPLRRRLSWLVLIVLVIGGVAWWIAERPARQPQTGRFGANGAPMPVVPATVQKGDIDIIFNALGTVTPLATVTVQTQINGQFTEIGFQEGQMVKKGDFLAQIDPRPYQAALDQAQGQLLHDQGLLKEAQVDLARYQKLASQNSIAQQQADDQAFLVQQYQGTVKSDEAAVENAQLNLVYCHIVAPITGRVGLRLVDPGNLITANSSTTLVVVTQMQPITVIFAISETSLPQVLEQIRQGKQLQVQAWDSNNVKELGVGKLISTDNMIDTATGTLKLRGEFPNSDGMLFPNQFVNAKLLVTTLQNQTMVPSSAIQHNGAVAFVFVVKPGPGKQQGESEPGTTNPAPAASAPKSKSPEYHVVMVNVKTGVSDNGMTGVQGIQPGDVVADSGFEKLVDGSTVTLSNQKLNIQQTTIGESEAP